MSDYLTEEQQVEALKNWWKEYGLSIVFGVVIAIVIIFGMKFYGSYKDRMGQNASIIYARMSIDVMNNQQQDATEQAKKLIKDYSRTPFAKLAALTLAKYAVADNNLADAATQLQWVIKKANSDVLKQLAQLRLARVYIAQNKIQQALHLLKGEKDSFYAGLLAEAQGDAYVKLGKLDEARQMYKQALEKIPSSEQSRPVLQMKLDNL